MLSVIGSIIGNCDSDQTNIRPTEIYNEGWMLKLVLNWFSQNPGIDHKLSFLPGSRWYSEALLPTQFKALLQKDKLSESHTNADGVIGNFCISSDISKCKKQFQKDCEKKGGKNKGEFLLCPDASQFIVLEAKMGSKLAGGVSNATFYNQAARNVACMAEVLKRAEIDNYDNVKLGFYVIAPQQQYDKKPREKESSFKKFLSEEDIRKTVKRRVEEYEDKDRDDYKDKLNWFNRYFDHLMKKIDIQFISWETIIIGIHEIEKIYAKDIKTCYGKGLFDFYIKCLESNDLNYPPKEFEEFK